MELSITHNENKKGIELLFSEKLPEKLMTFLRELGFKESLKDKNTWYADAHPAYKSFATSLRDAFSRGDDWKTVSMYPSFQPSLENIDKSKFSFVTISYRGKEKAEKDEYVLFDPYKKVATEIANQYAITKYGDDLQNIEVSPRNYKRKARILYDNRQIINRIKVDEKTEKENEPAKEVENELPIEDSKTKIEEPTEEVATENDSGYKTDKERQISTREILNEVIGKLAILEDRLEGEDETIIATTILDLEDAAEQSSELRFKNELLKKGIPENKIYLDYGGLRTLDSVVRLKEIFGQNTVTMISQEFHNERAIYLAEHFGIKAIGFNAEDVTNRLGFKTQIREYFARVKVFVDIIFNLEPKFLGEKIEIQ